MRLRPQSRRSMQHTTHFRTEPALTTPKWGGDAWSKKTPLHASPDFRTSPQAKENKATYHRSKKCTHTPNKMRLPMDRHSFAFIGGDIFNSGVEMMRPKVATLRLAGWIGE